VEVSIVVLVLVLLLGWLASRAWLAPARGTLPAAPASGGPAPATQSTPQSRPGAQPGQPPAPAAPAAPGASAAARASISFSFAAFEADPALVAGAISAGVPNLSGDSAIVVDLGSREVLYAKQPHKRQLMASTAKIMTAIVALERSTLDKVITVPVEATQVEPNHMGIQTGDQLTVEELLYGLMLDSGNDAGEAIAYGVGGGGPAGRAQFITWMNETAAALGLKDTHFANPSGLDDPLAYSTAYDLAVLGTYALGKPELRKIVATTDIIINPSKAPGRQHGWFHPGNLNSLLATYRGAIGIKPGYTEDAGYTLVGAAERDGRSLVCVTLNSRRHFSDCAALLDFGFSRPRSSSPTPVATVSPAPPRGERGQGG
jgi:D-alanyl-D-alanine carboxypeptidase (penicillin-binding protein 5/6)